ncbi:hypothetical protein [Corynebacterium sp.]|uniref:hypothetical protein n=1 Tax=Corynebacterium sp. TaxID=1720 RepID=UPI0025BCFF65|nr:hypothetical protein [Corynebacterium sp.]
MATPALVEETTLIVAVTGRSLVTWDPDATLPEGTGSVILLQDAASASSDAAADLIAQGIAVRTVTVTDGTGDAGDLGGGRVFHLPGQATDLAAHLGATDYPDLAVYGAAGGAGASTFAAALAGALADPALGGDGQALLIEASGHSSLDHLLGLENTTGRRLPELAGTSTLTAAMLRDLPWSGDVAVLSGTGPVPDYLDTAMPVVRDCGRWSGEEVAGAVTGRPVLVVPATVPGTMAGRRALAQIPGAAIVLREMPRTDLEWNDALTLLGRAPEVTWEDDPFLTAETDRGDFGPGQSTGAAGTAAARLVTALADNMNRDQP